MAKVQPALKTWIDQVNKAKDDAAVSALLGNILADDDVFAFGELFDNPKIKALQSGNGDAKKSHALLEVFAYGRYQDFKAKEAELPKLSEKQLIKLQQLTLVSVARDNRVLPYSTILQALGLQNERQVEELLIASLYKGILQGKLDSAKHQFKVESTIGRDVRPQDIDQMFKILQAWEKESATLLSHIEEKMSYAVREQSLTEQNKIEHVQHVEGLKATIKLVMETEMEGGMMNPAMGLMLGNDYGRHGGKTGKDKRNKHAYM